MKNGVSYIFIISLILILSLSLISAGWFSDLWGKITGKALFSFNYKCLDDDFGFNENFTKSKATLFDSDDRVIVSISDACSNENKKILNEAYCPSAKGSPAVKQVTCLNGCEDGACNKTSNSAGSSPNADNSGGSGNNLNICADVDAGSSESIISSKATLSDSNDKEITSIIDSCYNQTTLNEAYCPTSSGYPTTKKIFCENGCEGGICKSAGNVSSCSSKGGIICQEYEVCRGEQIFNVDSNRCCKGTCKLPDTFDWRNKHGENWNTPIRNQGQVGSCGVFAGIAPIESAINLFYNQHLNIDLSEQSVFSCSSELYNSSIPLDIEINKCFGIQNPGMNICFAKFFGILDENCYPYVDHMTSSTFICDNLCPNYKNRFWKVSNFLQLLSEDQYTQFVIDDKGNVVYSGPLMDRLNQEHLSEEGLKKAIIQYGPGGFTYLPMGHAMTLVGWTQIDNHQYWIVKNSWGTSFGYAGYWLLYDSDINQFSSAFVKTPIIPPTGEDYSISCLDKDGDKFCNWGISKDKPSTCPSYCKSEKDWDDYNSSIGALGIESINYKPSILPVNGIIETPEQIAVFFTSESAGVEPSYTNEPPSVECFSDSDCLYGKTCSEGVCKNSIANTSVRNFLRKILGIKYI